MDGQPWNVKGVEPDIRADALSAARQAGLTLGQWLNGVIRDSLVDMKAARTGPIAENAYPSRDPASRPGYPSSQQESVRQTMQHYPGQPPHPHAPLPQGYGAPPQPLYPAMAPYGTMPPAPPYPAPYMGYPPPGYDPVEARLRQYAQAGTETAVGPGPGNEQRLLTLIDAAVDNMQNSVRASERKTAAAIEALTSLVERVGQVKAAPAAAPAPVVQTVTTQADRPVQAQVRARAPAPAPAQAPAASGEAEQTNKTLAVLADRLTQLEKMLTESEAKRREGEGQQNKRQQPQNNGAEQQAARELEDKIGAALDALAREALPAAPPANGSAGRAPVRPAPPPPAGRPRVPVAPTRGAHAIAEIAARQRMLDAETQPRASSESAALDAIRRSIAALADQVKEHRAAPAVPNAAEADIYDLRNDLKELQKSLREIAPRETIDAMSRSIDKLAVKIEQSRQDGVRDSQLAPIEKLLADMRAAMGSVREPQAMGAVNEALAQMSRRIEDLGARSIDPRQIADLLRQFAEVRSALEEARQHQPMGDLNGEIARLSGKLDALAEAPRDGKVITLVAEAVEDMRRNMRRFDPDQLLARIDERLAALDTLEARIVDLGRQVETAQSRSPDSNGVDTITRQIERMTQSLSQRPVAAPDLSPVMAGINELRALVARGGQATDFGPLERRLAEVQAALQQRTAQPDIKGLEQILRKLADRIETVRAPAAGTAALDALQSQIITLAERIETGAPASPSLQGLEQSLGDLVRTVGSLKDITASAAERAVREAMLSQPPGGGMDPLAAEGMMLIKRDLTEMKSAQSDAENRSRETLQLINDTLGKIVSRLSTLEAEVARPRAAPAPVAPSLPPAPTAELAGNHDRIAPPLARPAVEEPRRRGPAPQAAPAPSAPDLSSIPPPGAGEPDLPLEPGSGLNGPLVAGPGESAGDPRSSFIAAARRAAQAAAAQTSAVLSEIDEKNGKKGKAAVASKLAGAKGFVAARRKPLLLGLAALVFALGGLKVATNFMEDEAPATTGSISSATPSRPAAPAKSPTLDRRQSAAEQSIEQGGKPLDISRAPGADTPTNEKRLAQAEEAVKSTLPKMALGPLGVDRTATGTVNATPPAAPAEQAMPTAVAPPEGTPTDIAGLMKVAPYSANERLREAAAKGNLAAVYEVGSRLAEGRGVTRDIKAGARWLAFAAEQGYVPAQYRFGSFNREGIGMAKDAKKAFVWFQRAAEQGHVLAMHNLGVLHAEGVNGQADYAAAASWFRNAAEHGVKDSQFNIAILYVRGLGITQDMTEAYKWFAAAAAQGDQDAAKKRDEVASKLQGEALAKAKEAYESFRAKRADPRANEVAVPEGGWDAVATKAAPAPRKATRT